VDSHSGLDGHEVCVLGHMGLCGQGLILSHEVCEMVKDAAQLCKLWSPPWFGVGGWASGWDTGGDEVCDFGKAVVEPEMKGVWSRESRGGGESHSGKKRIDVIPICVFPIETPGRGF